jgi:hypothetical protein
MRVIKIAICCLRRVFIHVFLACAISLQHISFAFGATTPEYNKSGDVSVCISCKIATSRLVMCRQPGLVYSCAWEV